MQKAIRMVGHDERLTVVDHLEELRGRLFVCLIALAVAFGVCFWQSHALLHIINRPVTKQTQHQVRSGGGPLGQTAIAQQSVLAVAGETVEIARELSASSSGLPAHVRAQLAAQIPRLRHDVAKVPRTPQGNKPVTLGVGEPFTSTVTVSFYFALLIALPVILFELYGFVIPAMTPKEQRIARPLAWAVPLLFIAGVLFGYFIVLPAAVHFLQSFNSSEFNVLVQASPYYGFAATTLLAMGLAFEVPVVVLGATTAGLVSARTLRKGRPYALLGCIIIAALLPSDAVTMLLEALPMYVLYEVSILLASLGERRRARAGPAEVPGTSPAALP
jgi:sec-independent protein translocase protein TatC